MIRINLLPFRAARKKENIRRQVSIYFLSVAFLIALMGYFFLDLSATRARLVRERDEKKKELATYVKITQRIKEIERKNKALETKLGVIRELEKNKTGPVRLLAEIADAVPRERLFLDSLDEKRGVLDLKGTAMDNDTVALFMTNLQKSKLIQSVDLTSTKLRNVTKENIGVTDFVLSAKTYLHQEEKKEEGAKGPGKPVKRQ